MEELLVYALLLYENIVTEEEYFKRLDELFLQNPENDDLLYLEWETQVEKAVAYIRAHVPYKSFDYELFGSIMMEKIKVYYERSADIMDFAHKMYRLWKGLPGNFQEKQPFCVLCYADEPLLCGDEEQTRNIYLDMMNYYKH